jgi:hypothetical protein
MALERSKLIRKLFPSLPKSSQCSFQKYQIAFGPYMISNVAFKLKLKLKHHRESGKKREGILGIQ